MRIRTRLLWLLLPPLIMFITLISGFFFYNWYTDIKTGFRSQLKSIVISLAETIPGNDMEKLEELVRTDKNAAEVEKSKLYQKYRNILDSAKEKLPVSSLYIISVEPVNKGETVLLNQPPSAINKVYEGLNRNYAYRQIYLIDANTSPNQHPRNHHPGDYDFSESDEQTVYYTKKAFVTPTYLARGTNERFMTGYAPIFNGQGGVSALLAADFSLEVMDKKLQNAILVILLSAAITTAFVVICVYLVADYISKPVQKLNNAALTIAAGSYEENIRVKGPLEVVELANTLNTMSECMQDNIHRLQESAMVRERMYGEYECSLLLQRRMLKDVVDSFQAPFLRVGHISASSSITPKGLFLEINRVSANQNVEFRLWQAAENGFSGLFSLLCDHAEQPEAFPHLRIVLDGAGASMQWQSFKLPKPCVWSGRSEKVLFPDADHYLLNDRDYLFLFSESFAELFESEKEIAAWFEKVLKHFAPEEFDLCIRMLERELFYASKQEFAEQDLHILCLRFDRTTPDNPRKGSPE